MATLSSIFAWKVPWTEEAGGVPSMGPQRVGHNYATEHLHIPITQGNTETPGGKVTCHKPHCL